MSMLTMKSVKKHSHLFFVSLSAAIVFHLAIIIFFTNFNQRNPYLTTFNPEKVYPISLLDSSTGGIEQFSKVGPAKKTQRKMSGSLTGVFMNRTDTIESEKISGDGVGEEIGDVGSVMQSQKNTELSFDQNILSYQQPLYPKAAQLRALEGEVTIRLKVTPEGEAIGPIILKSSGHQILDQAALSAALTWRFHKRKSGDFLLVDKTVVFKKSK